jgi:hypothetical protein
MLTAAIAAPHRRPDEGTAEGSIGRRVLFPRHRSFLPCWWSYVAFVLTEVCTGYDPRAPTVGGPARACPRGRGGLPLFTERPGIGAF